MKTKKKRGGWQRWRRETQLPFKDDIGYFYDCKPIVVPNKSKYREHGIITGDRDGNELMRPQELKIVKMEDSETYDPQLILVDMALPEGQRGMRWFRRRAQDFCDRGYKPLKRNDNMTGAGRKKKTRKKKKTKKRRNKKRKNKKTRKRKQKGRGVNICQMLSDPERFGYTKKEVRAMALSRAVKARRKIPEGRCVGKRVAQVEGHHYCQEMNNWDDNYKCHEKSGNCVKIIKPRIKKAINDKLRSYGYKL